MLQQPHSKAAEQQNGFESMLTDETLFLSGSHHTQHFSSQPCSAQNKNMQLFYSDLHLSPTSVLVSGILQMARGSDTDFHVRNGFDFDVKMLVVVISCYRLL